MALGASSHQHAPTRHGERLNSIFGSTGAANVKPYEHIVHPSGPPSMDLADSEDAIAVGDLNEPLAWRPSL